MKHYWNIFWKFFGIVVLGMFVVAGIAGIVTRSMTVVYTIAQHTFAGALGICGIIGLTVPIGLYLDARKHKEENNVVE
jgi:hypothetical protein